MTTRNSFTRSNTFERSKTIDSDSVDIDQKEIVVTAEQTAAGRNAMAERVIETDPMYSTAQIDEEAFLRQELEIHFHDAPTDDDAQFVEVTVNGDRRVARRGDTVKLPRAHVGVLCDAKQARMVQKKIVSPDGSMGYEERMVTQLSYPFSTVYDPAGKRGAEWLKKKLSQAA
jgi:hypothetical protein